MATMQDRTRGLGSSGPFMWLHTAWGSAGPVSARWFSSMPGRLRAACPEGEDFQPPQQASATLSKSHSKGPIWAGASPDSRHIARGPAYLMGGSVVIRQSTFQGPLTVENGNCQSNPNSRSLLTHAFPQRGMGGDHSSPFVVLYLLPYPLRSVDLGSLLSKTCS